MRARAATEAPDAINYVSAATAWELATRVRFGKWPEAADIAENLEPIAVQERILLLPVTVQHGRVAGFLSGAHRDPFDRMLAAQAQIEGMTLVTADPAFQEFSVDVLW